MARDYFSVLGLTRGRHDPHVIERRFLEARERVVGGLFDPATYETARAELEALHLAYATLRDPARQSAYLRSSKVDDGGMLELRALIAACLEEGLLRHSRRQMILRRAEALGVGEFQAQLLIAQVQFGGEALPDLPRVRPLRRRGGHPRGWAQVAAVGVLALVMFLGLVGWVGG
jgi:hypothetical protein